MEFNHIQTRADKFQSRFFDFQKSYKYLVKFEDNNSIETSAYEHFLQDSRVDLAIDISTMVGCPMGCLFCASSSINYKRNLDVNEIFSQAEYMINKYGTSFEQLTCSFQGIGEPSLIADKIIYTSKKLLTIDRRVVLSISTIGSSRSGVLEIANSGLPIDNLQITLCGTTKNDVKSIVPNAMDPSEVSILVNKLCKLRNLKKVKINYLLLKGINDSEHDLRRLISLFKDSGIIIKISFLNQTKSSKAHCLESGSQKKAKEFKEELIRNNIDSFIFGSLDNIEVSCGQLVKLETE